MGAGKEQIADGKAVVVDIDSCKAVIANIVEDYCKVNEIDENNIYPQIWNDIIDEIHEVIFKHNPRLLRDDTPLYNSYNQDKVLYIYNIYKRLCNSHCQEITQKGFLDMTGIDKQTMYNWAAKYGEGTPNPERIDLHQKIMDDNEQSLEAMLHDRRYNPMKVLPSLNKKHGWNLPGVSREAGRKQALSVSQLPKLGELSGVAESVQTPQSIVQYDDIFEDDDTT